MRRILIAAVLVSAHCWAAPQQSMPDMDMGQHEQSTPAAAQKPKSMQMPMDMTRPQPGDTPAKAATESMQNSDSQQRQQETTEPGAGSDAMSLSRPTQTLQEQENQTFHTGSDLPAPELLKDIAQRPPLSVDEFLAMAEKFNPTLAQARASVRRSEQRGRQAGLLPNPTLGYSGDQIRGGEYGGGEQGAYIQQELVLGGKLELRRNIYRQQAGSDQIEVSEQEYRVRSGVQRAFYMALSDQALVRTRQSLLKVALEAVETAHRLENLGEADAPDILQAEVEAEQAKIDFVHAQREYLEDFQTLSAVAGAQQLGVSPLKGDLEHPPQIDAEQQVATILAGSPSLHHAQQDVAVAEAKLKDAKREPVPNLTLRAGEYYSGETIGSSGKPAGPESFAEAGISIPLWNRNQGNIAAAMAELESARQEVARTQLDLKRKAEPLAQHYLSARFEAERYRTQLLPRSRRAYELYLMKYQQMAAAYPQVLSSQRMLFQLQVNYLQALNEEWSAALGLQNYTLTHGLDQPVSTGQDTTMLNLPGGENQ